MSKRSFVIICILFLFLLVEAQKKVYVRGYILDEKQQAVELATVFERNQIQGTTSNTSGFYELILEESDTFLISFSCIGYQSVEKKIVPNEQSISLNITMNTDVTELETIEIRSLQRQVSTMQKIDPKTIKLIPDISGGIESLLATFAGVHSTNEMSSHYSVRGGNYDENIVYVNNIEIYRPLLIRAGQQEGLSFINPDLVGEVSFSSGGYDAKYGDKMSSVLDIFYKRPDKPFEANLMLSLLGSSAYVGSAAKNFTQIHGIRYKTSNYLLGTLDTKGEYAQNFVDYQTYMTFRFSEKWSGSFLGNFSQNSYRFIPQDRETTYGTYQEARKFKVYFEGQEKDIFRTLFGAFSVDYKPIKSVNLSLIASAFNTNEQETYDIRGEYWLSDVDIYGENSTADDTPTLGAGMYHEHARNRLSATVANISSIGSYKNERHHVQWGLTAQGEFIQDRINEWEFRDSAGYSLPFDLNKVDLIYNLKSNLNLNTWHLTAYAQETYKLIFPRAFWSFTGGVRANYWSFNNEWLISPRLSISVLPNWKHDFSFRFAAGLYYQAPFYKEIRKKTTDEFGNSHLLLNKKIMAQRSLHLLLGADYHFRLWRRPFKLTLETYYKPSDRINPYYVDNVRIRYAGENIAKAYSVGVDLKLFGEFVPGADSWISISWMQAREDILNDSYKVYSNAGNYVGTVEPKWIPRPNEQRYSISLFYQDYVPNNPEYKLFLKVIWADGLPFGAPNSERYQATLRTKAYRRVDIGASRNFVAGREKFMKNSRIVKEWGINLEILNLFNIKNVNSYYWITDIYNQQNAIPNYLTGILFNVKFNVRF